MIWDSLTDETKLERTNAQILFEQDMLEYGRHKYWKDYNRAPDEGIPEQELLDSCVKEIRDVFQEWIDKLCKNPRTPAWVHPLVELGSQKVADITIRAVIKSWFSKNFWGYHWDSEKIIPPLAQSVATQIAQDCCDIISFQRARENNRDEWLKQSKFIKNWTAKRCKAFSEKLQENIKLSVKQKHDFGHQVLRIAASINVIILTHHTTKRNGRIRKYLSVEFHPEILKELHKRHEILQNSTLVYRPMISKPDPHCLHRSGGYIHTPLRKPVVQRYRSNFFGDDKKEQRFSEPSELVLDGLNELMSTEWAINTDVLNVMENMFTNNSGLGNLPFYSFEEFMFNEPYPKDGSREDQAKWCQRREEGWGKWYKQEQARGRMLVRLNLAKDLVKWDCFYHVYTLDFRGRAYTTCELLSPQSSDFDRSLIMLAEPQELNDEGRYWQKVNLANLFDQDKVTFDERVKWVDDNWDMIQRISKDPYENKEWLDDSVKKNKSFQRLAAIFDITRTDGMSYLHVYLDGKCNGNQHWAAIMKDSVIGKLTGVLPSDQPEDLYQFVADVTTTHCNKMRKENEWYDIFLTYWQERILRKVTKRSTMCEPYGLTFYGIQRYLKEEGHLNWVDPEKKGGAIVELARAIKASLDKTLTEPNKGKAFLKEVTGKANEQNKHLIWTTPSGFKVVHYYNRQQKRRSLSSLFNRKELVFYVRTDDVNPREALQAISPNFIHSLDAAHMFLTIKLLIQKSISALSMVHDSYGCRPNDVPTMQNALRTTFVDIHQKNQLKIFKRQIEYQLGTKLPDPPEEGDMDVRDVLQSKYFFA